MPKPTGAKRRPEASGRKGPYLDHVPFLSVRSRIDTRMLRTPQAHWIVASSALVESPTPRVLFSRSRRRPDHGADLSALTGRLSAQSRGVELAEAKVDMPNSRNRSGGRSRTRPLRCRTRRVPRSACAPSLAPGSASSLSHPLRRRLDGPAVPPSSRAVGSYVLRRHRQVVASGQTRPAYDLEPGSTMYSRLTLGLALPTTRSQGGRRTRGSSRCGGCR